MYNSLNKYYEEVLKNDKKYTESKAEQKGCEICKRNKTNVDTDNYYYNRAIDCLDIQLKGYNY